MNKRVILSAVAGAMLLSGCAHAENNILTRTVGSKVLNNQCHTFLEKQQVWQIAKLTMKSSKVKDIEDKVCSCASDEAAKNITSEQMVQLANPSTRNQAIVDVLLPTVQTCFSKLQGQF